MVELVERVLLLAGELELRGEDRVVVVRQVLPRGPVEDLDGISAPCHGWAAVQPDSNPNRTGIKPESNRNRIGIELESNWNRIGFESESNRT